MTDEIINEKTDHGPLGYCADCITGKRSPARQAATLWQGTGLCGEHVMKRDEARRNATKLPNL